MKRSVSKIKKIMANRLSIRRHLKFKIGVKEIDNVKVSFLVTLYFSESERPPEFPFTEKTLHDLHTPGTTLTATNI